MDSCNKGRYSGDSIAHWSLWIRNNKEKQSYDQWNSDRDESEQGIKYMDLLNEEGQAMMDSSLFLILMKTK